MSYTAGVRAPAMPIISTVDTKHAVFTTAQTIASGTYPTAFLALYVPVLIESRCIVRKLGIANGATASGNLDLGLYSVDGVRLTSAGSTAQAGTSAEQWLDVADVTIQPGCYYLAVAFDGTTGTVQRASLSSAPAVAAAGVLTQDLGASVVLPATATFARTHSLTFYPILMAATATNW